MTDIPDRPFDKIAIDLVTDLNISTPGNQHILTITDHLTGWPEAFQIPDKKADAIVHVLINNYLSTYSLPSSCLTFGQISRTNKWTMSSTLGIDHIFSAPIIPKVMEN